MSEPEQSEDLREQARERVEDMPAETALGNRDPQGGGQGEPSDFASQADQQ
jgi:hypothetical protein